jgi:hypothetical protein
MPDTTKTIEPVTRFFHHVDITDDGHWIWTGNTTDTHPRFWVSRDFTQHAARFIFGVFHKVDSIGLGPFQRLCGVPLCVHPEHNKPSTWEVINNSPKKADWRQGHE